MQSSIRQLLLSLPQPQFGEDEYSYFRRMMAVTQNNVTPFPLQDLREACNLRYKWMSAEYLINKIEQGGELTEQSIKKAVVMLLKEMYEP